MLALHYRHDGHYEIITIALMGKIWPHAEKVELVNHCGDEAEDAEQENMGVGYYLERFDGKDRFELVRFCPGVGQSQCVKALNE